MDFIRKTIHRQPEFGNENGPDTENCSRHFIQEVDRLRTAQRIGQWGCTASVGSCSQESRGGSAGSCVDGNEPTESAGSGPLDHFANPSDEQSPDQARESESSRSRVVSVVKHCGTITSRGSPGTLLVHPSLPRYAASHIGVASWPQSLVARLAWRAWPGMLG